MVIIFITVFIDLVGFAVILPLTPYLARTYGADAFEVGMLMAIYSAAQFLFSPFWGGLSDKIGRRPVILVSLLGAAIFHTLFAFATQLWMLYVVRFIAGAFAANISTAMAYMADISTNENRTKSMGIIGAAFGLGFILGPFLGGLVGSWGEQLGSTAPLGQSLAAVFAGVICLINFIVAFFILPESLKPEDRQTHFKAKSGRLKKILESLREPLVGKIQWLYFVLTLSMSLIEASLFLFVQDRFSFTVLEAGLGFAYVGVWMVITQGYLIRKLLASKSELALLRAGLILLTLSYVTIALSENLFVLTAGVTLLAIGYGISNPSTTGMLSLLTHKTKQGQVFGVNQSLAALSRVFGPLAGGWLYKSLNIEAPFLAASLLALLICVASFKLKESTLKQKMVS